MIAIRKILCAKGAQIVDISIPEIGEHDLLVQIKAIAMCKPDVKVFEWSALLL